MRTAFSEPSAPSAWRDLAMALLATALAALLGLLLASWTAHG
jgi:ABC-type phosphate/phosphonate transport system permease subunit